MMTITMTSRGYVTIPSVIRKRLKIKPGTMVRIIEKDDGVALVFGRAAKRVLK